MINTDSKTSYIDSRDLIEDTFNIIDSYRDISNIWCRWLKDNNIGISLYSFRKYYDYLLSSHYSASTINMNLVMMRNRILYLFDKTNNKIDERATLEYKMKLIKAPTMPIKAVSMEKIFSNKEVNNLISLSGKRSSIIIEFLYITACRRNELCSILIRDCKEKRHHVEINLYGKRNKIRTAVITFDLYRAILRVFNGKKFLFENTNNKQYTGHSIWELVMAASIRILNRPMSPHMLRHTRITHLYAETSDMKAVSLFAGHSSIKTSLDYYVHNGFDKKVLLGSFKDQ